MAKPLLHRTPFSTLNIIILILSLGKYSETKTIKKGDPHDANPQVFILGFVKFGR